MIKSDSGLMLHLTPYQIKALCILADEKPHFQKDMAAKMNIPNIANFGEDVLKPLKKFGFCHEGEPIKKGGPGRPPRPLIITSCKSVGQFLRDQVLRDVELLKSAQLGKGGIHTGVNCGNLMTIIGYAIDRPSAEIDRLEKSLTGLIEWCEKRNQIHTNWKFLDGIGQVDETMRLADGELDKVKKLFSEVDRILDVAVNNIEVRIHASSVKNQHV